MAFNHLPIESDIPSSPPDLDDIFSISLSLYSLSTESIGPSYLLASCLSLRSLTISAPHCLPPGNNLKAEVGSGLLLGLTTDHPCLVSLKPFSKSIIICFCRSYREDDSFLMLASVSAFIFSASLVRTPKDGFIFTIPP